MSATPTGVEPSRVPLLGRRVLVIEDEYFLADDIARALSSLGAEIIGPVAEIEEAQRIVNAGTAIDGAVLDLNIRSEMAFPLARTLRANQVPFLFTTGYDKNSIQAEFQDVQLWEKPLDVPGMALALTALMLKRGH
jgi:DNA-binding response OmpR family regulator